MKKLFFLTLLALITINIAGAEKSDFTLTPGILCRNLHTDRDFEFLVETMTNRVIANLKVELSDTQFRALDYTSIAEDIRQGLIDSANEKAPKKAKAGSTTRRLVRPK